MGYNSTNIYRIQNPTIYTVKGYRDIIFDENKRYHIQAELPVQESELYLQYIEIPLPKYLTIILDTDNDFLSLLPSQRDREYNPGSNQPPPPELSLSSKPTIFQILTPPSTTASTPTLSRSQSQQPEPPEPEITTQTQQASLNILQPNISARSRRNVLRPDYYQLHNIGNKQANYIVSGNDYLDSTILDLYSVFSAAVATIRPHRDHLSPPPILWKALRLYLYTEGFITAAQKEYNILKIKNIFYIRPTLSSEKPIPLIQILIYKFDKGGYLAKFKACIYVRGDLQSINKEEIYAAILAFKVFRSLMVIVAKYRLEAQQLDIINVFCNAMLPTPIYISMPEGFEIPGISLELL